jgi:redox-sensitive bicupin YhaK (pirin superfamily)
MIEIRRSDERGHANLGWLDSRFSFSFADYYDPKHMGFRSLRVINDDKVAGGAGFGMHPHQDMEIITYMLDGSLAHKDSMGNGSTIRPGEVQRMTAGTGIRHSEFNPSDETAHLLQIWLLPRERGLKPSYDQKFFPGEAKAGKLALIASPDGRDGSMRIEQDATLYASWLTTGESVRHELAPGRHAWLQVARGTLKLGDNTLHQGDGAAVSDEAAVVIEGQTDEGAEFLLFDLN